MTADTAPDPTANHDAPAAAKPRNARDVGIRQRGNTWTAYWWAPDTNGTLRQRSRGGFKTKTKAREHRTAQLAAINAGTYREIIDDKITVAQWLREHWLPGVRTEATTADTQRRASTLTSYTIAAESWIIPHVGGIKLVALTPSHIEGMLTALAESGGRHGQPLSARSRQVAHGVLKMALTRAVEHGYLRRNPAAISRRPGVTHREISPWTDDEARTFLAAVADDPLYAAWVLFLARGPRRGEVAGLRWSDVDLDRGRLVIRHTRVSLAGTAIESTPKTKAGGRTIFLDPSLVAIFRRHRARQLADRLAAGPAWVESDLVFVREDGSPVHPEHLSTRFLRLCTLTGVRRVRLHDLRHTAASLMLAAGTSVKIVQEMLGHASPMITQSIYGHLMPGMAEDASAAHSAALGLVAD